MRKVTFSVCAQMSKFWTTQNHVAPITISVLDKEGNIVDEG